MTELSPCPTCDRHVHVGETSCPFCGGQLAELVASSADPARRLPRSLLTRAAVFAGATLLAPGCVKEAPSQQVAPPQQDERADDGDGNGVTDTPDDTPDDPPGDPDDDRQFASPPPDAAPVETVEPVEPVVPKEDKDWRDRRRRDDDGRHKMPYGAPPIPHKWV